MTTPRDERHHSGNAASDPGNSKHEVPAADAHPEDLHPFVPPSFVPADADFPPYPEFAPDAPIPDEYLYGVHIRLDDGEETCLVDPNTPVPEDRDLAALFGPPYDKLVPGEPIPPELLYGVVITCDPDEEQPGITVLGPPAAKGVEKDPGKGSAA